MDNSIMRRKIRDYREDIKRQKAYEMKLSYQSKFGIKDDEINTLDIKGIATDKKENKLIMAEDREDKQKLLLYADKNNSMYYLNSGQNYKEAIQNTFGKDVNYELVEDELFVYNNERKTLNNYEQLNEYHNREKELEYKTKLEEERKSRLINHSEVNKQAKQDLALSLGLTATAFSSEMYISDIEKVNDNESMVTLEDQTTGKQQHLISDFKDNFVNKVQETLTITPSMRIGFEEFKNASAQIAMGFLEFYGARFDESHLEHDPKVVANEKGYSISVFDKNGNKKELSNADTFEEAVKLSKEIKKDKELEMSTDDLEIKQELEKKRG